MRKLIVAQVQLAQVARRVRLAQPVLPARKVPPVPAQLVLPAHKVPPVQVELPDYKVSLAQLAHKAFKAFKVVLALSAPVVLLDHLVRPVLKAQPAQLALPAQQVLAQLVPPVRKVFRVFKASLVQRGCLALLVLLARPVHRVQLGRVAAKAQPALLAHKELKVTLAPLVPPVPVQLAQPVLPVQLVLVRPVPLVLKAFKVSPEQQEWGRLVPLARLVQLAHRVQPVQLARKVYRVFKVPPVPAQLVPPVRRAHKVSLDPLVLKVQLALPVLLVPV